MKLPIPGEIGVGGALEVNISLVQSKMMTKDTQKMNG